MEDAFLEPAARRVGRRVRRDRAQDVRQGWLRRCCEEDQRHRTPPRHCRSRGVYSAAAAEGVKLTDQPFVDFFGFAGAGSGVAVSASLKPVKWYRPPPYVPTRSCP